MARSFYPGASVPCSSTGNVPCGFGSTDASSRIAPSFAAPSSTGNPLATSPMRSPSVAAGTADARGCGLGVSANSFSASPDFPQGDPWSRFTPTTEMEGQSQQPVTGTGGISSPMHQMFQSGIFAITTCLSKQASWKPRSWWTSETTWTSSDRC